MLFARLHGQSLEFKPIQGFTQLKMSGPFGRGEQVVLWDEAARATGALNDWAILDETRRRVEQAFAGLYADPCGLRVIHNDLWHGNIKVDGRWLRPLDFEDTVWGYPVQDLAMAIQDLMMDVAPQNFEPFRAALQRGYERLATWPEQVEHQIDLFRAGRMLWVANYVALNEQEYLGEHLGRTARLLEGFLETGRMHR
jgi:Ser/Thr protein kinase RdoA (MazF antagonist)